MQMLRPEPFLLSTVSVVENFFPPETLLGQQQSHQLLLFVVRTYYIMIWRIQPDKIHTLYVQFLHFKHDFFILFQIHTAANVPFELAVNFNDNEVMANGGDAMTAEAGANPGGIIGKFTFPDLKDLILISG